MVFSGWLAAAPEPLVSTGGGGVGGGWPGGVAGGREAGKQTKKHEVEEGDTVFRSTRACSVGSEVEVRKLTLVIFGLMQKFPHRVRIPFRGCPLGPIDDFLRPIPQ